MTQDKVRVNKLRRVAERQGMKLHKVRRYDPKAIDYGTFYLWDTRHNALIFPASYEETGIGASLEEIEEYLTK